MATETRKEYDLGVILSNVEQMLLRACEEQKRAIVAFGEAHDLYAKDFVAYRKAKSEAVKRLRAQGEKVSVISDLANGETAELKGEELKSEGQMQKCKMMVRALEERINAIKFIGRRLDNAEKNSQ